MLFKRKVPAPNPVIVERDRVLAKMSKLEPDSPEYTKMLVAVNRLQAMIPQKEDRRVKPETWANIAAYLGNSAMVLHHEKLNVITSKMFGARPPRP